MGNQNDIFKDMDIRKLKQRTTPTATAVMCFLNKPSFEYNPDGVYIAKIKLPTESQEAKTLIKIIDTAAEEAYVAAMELAETPKAKKAVKKADMSYKYEEDDDGNETGYVLINFKRKATRKDKEGNIRPVKLPLFDSMGQPMDSEETEIWSGSELKISYKLVPYNKSIGVGVSHRIEAVQVVKLSSGGDNRSAADFGFKAESILEGEGEEEDSAESTNVDHEEDGDY